MDGCPARGAFLARANRVSEHAMARALRSACVEVDACRPPGRYRATAAKLQAAGPCEPALWVRTAVDGLEGLRESTTRYRRHMALRGARGALQMHLEAKDGRSEEESPSRSQRLEAQNCQSIDGGHIRLDSTLVLKGGGLMLGGHHGYHGEFTLLYDYAVERKTPAVADVCPFLQIASPP